MERKEIPTELGGGRLVGGKVSHIKGSVAAEADRIRDKSLCEVSHTLPHTILLAKVLLLTKQGHVFNKTQCSVTARVA